MKHTHPLILVVSAILTAGLLVSCNKKVPNSSSEAGEKTEEATSAKQGSEQASSSSEASTEDTKKTSDGSSVDTSGEKEEIETSLPMFERETVDGQTISTRKIHGNVAMINFWGTWCAPCIREIPHFQEKYEEWKEEGFTILGIAVPQKDGTGGLEDVKNFIKENNMTYPVIMNDGIHEQFQDAYGPIQGVPTTYVIDRDGTLVRTFVGYTKKEKLEEVVKPLLSE